MLAMTASAPSFAAQNLLVNGSFETGSFSRWTAIAPNQFTFVQCGPWLGSVIEMSATDGECHALFNSPLQTSIRQSVATRPGRAYRISFDLTNVFSDATYAVSFDNVVLGGGIQSGLFFQQRITFDQVASGGSGTLEFSFHHDRDWWGLDNVSVVELAVPEPATWALMISGFALTGLAMRRRKVALET